MIWTHDELLEDLDTWNMIIDPILLESIILVAFLLCKYDNFYSQTPFKVFKDPNGKIITKYICLLLVTLVDS